MTISLLPDNPAAWCYRSWDELMSIPREEREKLQLEAVRINFHRMRDRIPAPALVAFLPVSLTELYLDRLARMGEKASTTVADVPQFRRQLRLWWMARRNAF